VGIHSVGYGGYGKVHARNVLVDKPIWDMIQSLFGFS